MAKFLVKFDFQTLIDEANIDELTDSDDVLLNNAIDSAIEEAASYIRHRYDYDKTFKVVQSYNIATSFIINDRVFDPINKLFYVCTKDSLGNAVNNVEFFTLSDNRNAKIKQIVMDIVLYNIHSKISPRNIPELRRVRYDGYGNKQNSGNALRYLEQIQKGQITPSLPIIEPIDQNSERISYGTTPNIKYNY